MPRALPCENCGRDTTGPLHPCPCGITDCPIAHGVCNGCRARIQRNAIDWHRERRKTAG